MQITDINDQQITITELSEAIKQAAMFSEYRHKDEGFSQRDNALMIYWTDVHCKLLKLQSKLNYYHARKRT